MSTCHRLDLQTLGSQPIIPKNLPDHWWRQWYPEETFSKKLKEWGEIHILGVEEILGPELQHWAHLTITLCTYDDVYHKFTHKRQNLSTFSNNIKNRSNCLTLPFQASCTKSNESVAQKTLNRCVKLQSIETTYKPICRIHDTRGTSRGKWTRLRIELKKY